MAGVLIRLSFVHYITERTCFLSKVLLHMDRASLFILCLLSDSGHYILIELVLVIFHLLNPVAIEYFRIFMLKLTSLNLLFLNRFFSI